MLRRGQNHCPLSPCPFCSQRFRYVVKSLQILFGEYSYLTLSISRLNNLSFDKPILFPSKLPRRKSVIPLNLFRLPPYEVNRLYLRNSELYVSFYNKNNLLLFKNSNPPYLGYLRKHSYYRRCSHLNLLE